MDGAVRRFKDGCRAFLIDRRACFGDIGSGPSVFVAAGGGATGVWVLMHASLRASLRASMRVRDQE